MNSKENFQKEKGNFAIKTLVLIESPEKGVSCEKLSK